MRPYTSSSQNDGLEKKERQFVSHDAGGFSCSGTVDHSRVSPPSDMRVRQVTAIVANVSEKSAKGTLLENKVKHKKQ